MDSNTFQKLISLAENEHIEFKEAKTQFDYRNKLLGYCIAIANEKGGKLILGVTNKKPRKVVGTKAFRDIQKIKSNIFHDIHMRVSVEEYFESGKRVLIFHIPSRPVGKPLSLRGKYLMRVGESLEPMSPELIKSILLEGEPDFSAQICEGCTINDLSKKAIKKLRKRILRAKRLRKNISHISDLQLLSDLGLIEGHSVNYAGLIMLGKETALRKYLANAEIIYEYRLHDSSIRPDVSIHLRKALIFSLDLLWKEIDSRNRAILVPNRFSSISLFVFNENTIREAILNAIAHRDFRDQRSVFIRQGTNKIIVENPGGFMEGVNPDNIIEVHKPRNRRLAEALYDCGYVERAGQGADLMFSQQILEGKSIPDYSKSDVDTVRLEISGDIIDYKFLEVVEDISSKYDGDPPINVLLTKYKELIHRKTVNELIKSLSETEGKIINAIQRNNKITIKELSAEMDISTTSVEKHINKLKKNRIIKRVGTHRSGYWKIIV